ncbi:MAG: DUF899 domain-containing protein [Actinopolymorphaceae bacterium]
MALPEIVSPEQWRTARTEFLAREKEFTRARDALNADRRRLPMVRIDKEYAFEGEGGRASLLELFDDCRQLIVYHAMFDPSWEKACPGCTAALDESTDGLLAHLKSRDTAYVRISRAPYPKIAAFGAERGWTFPWYSSYGSDFNYDFHVTLDAAVTPIEYNYRNQAELTATDPDWATPRSTEMPGYSCFLRDGDAVFHTYSTYARGTETPNDTYSLLDLTALGRQEDWEEPAGRAEDARSADPTFS